MLLCEIKAMMGEFLALLVLSGLLQHLLPNCSCMEFDLDGKYLLGGLFDVHTTTTYSVRDRPLELDCSKQLFTLASYRRLQVMRFAVQEINNSTLILPNQSLGYEIFDFCSNVLKLPTVLSLMSSNGSIEVKDKDVDYLSKVIGIIGPYKSADTITIAPLFMMHLIPMINYGAASSALSEKSKYPSFFRTVPSNHDNIQLIVSILQHYKWHWVAFITSQDAYSEDGLDLFISMIKDTEICLAYTANVKKSSNVLDMFRTIDNLGVNVIVVFTLLNDAEVMFQTAITSNIQQKVWIASDVWFLDEKLPKLKGIETIGTIIGVTLSVAPLPGFEEYLNFSKEQGQCTACALDSPGEMLCRPACDECTAVGAEEILSEDVSHNFAVYASVYALANALHNVLECSNEGCNDNVTVHPFMLLRELKKSNFTLLNQNVQFDVNGDPVSASYEILFWKNGYHVMFGSYKTYPNVQFFINNSKIQWHTNSSVPVSQCSPDCQKGFVRNQNGDYKCCFKCEICPRDTYIDRTVSLYQCKNCLKTEWSEPGSIACLDRTVEYVSYTELFAIVILVLTSLLLGLTLAVTILFARNFDTPVVKSAGGPMCVLVLGCLSVASFNVFFYLGKPTEISCFLRILYVLLFTICLACLGVRSFQIVCIFKMATKFPGLYKWWTKYNGQWLVIAGTFLFQVLLLLAYVAKPPKPYNDTTSKNLIIMRCDFFCYGPLVISNCFLAVLCMLCFIISYIGKNLPKNYNEAKPITFCLLILILIWMAFGTTTMLYKGKYIQGLDALAVVCSLYSILLWYFLPKCYIIIFQPQRNTQQHFQGLIQSYTLNISN
ncbi:taste receptor type 1 member 1 [Hypomesus transpacificus]|uniref:taste receptor type 1 member 1 n=1 Tax=Hypomesus transpacificus TaxID=137520 RepID=UPI001F07A612|nr:taste receptor type 1 member 1 [Hypomesus transpacificus]